MPTASATTSWITVGTWHGAHTSAVSPRSATTQFCGSIGAWARYGAWYTASMVVDVRIAQRLVGVAVAAHLHAALAVGAGRALELRRVEALDEPLAPLDLDVAGGAQRLPVLLGHHRHAPAEREDVDHAGRGAGPLGAHRGRLRAVDRPVDDQGAHHARHRHVDAEASLAGDLGPRVDPARVLADQAELARALEARLVRHRLARGAGREAAVAGGAPAGPVDDAAVLGGAVGGGHAPLARRRGHQHLARGRRRPAQRDVGLGRAGRAAGGVDAEHRHALGAAGAELGQRVGEGDVDVVDRDLQLLGHQRAVAGGDALPHLALADGERDAAVRLHRHVHVGRQLAGLVGAAHHAVAGRRRRIRAGRTTRPGTARRRPARRPGSRAGSAARRAGRVTASPSPAGRPPAGWRGGCADRCRSGTGWPT